MEPEREWGGMGRKGWAEWMERGNNGESGSGGLTTATSFGERSQLHRMNHQSHTECSKKPFDDTQKTPRQPSRPASHRRHSTREHHLTSCITYWAKYSTGLAETTFPMNHSTRTQSTTTKTSYNLHHYIHKVLDSSRRKDNFSSPRRQTTGEQHPTTCTTTREELDKAT